MAFLSFLFPSVSTSSLKKIESIVEKINALEPNVKEIRGEDFPQKTQELQARYKQGESLDELLPEAFALVREASFRTLGMRHYDVQLIGGCVIHQGMIAEMRTGEGKTLVATLPTYLNALAGKGVHLVTVNDYLAKRDADWMGQVYSFLGLQVSVIIGGGASFIYDESYMESVQQGTPTDEMRDTTGNFRVFGEYLRPCTRHEAYLTDITYGTNNEFGFDYLRDNIQISDKGLVQREHFFAVVDEIDSVLIDEARVPLILSSRAMTGPDLYLKYSAIARQMNATSDFIIDEKSQSVAMTDEGISKAEQLLGVENLYTDQDIQAVHFLETALRAHFVYTKDKEYILKNGKVMIVDPFTGRVQEGRRWSDGLHQAIEAKENVAIQEETRTSASITYQNYFKLYKKLSGMTGTASTSSEEFLKVYGLDVIEIPTHKPNVRKDNIDYIFSTEQGKFKAIAEKIKAINVTGQPILVGTASVEKSELLSAYLMQSGIKHEILNAKNHEREGEIIAQAGKLASVVIATNMAGRGVDIKLGGNPARKEEEKKVLELGGLFVLGTERHESRRIDNQLRGRSGRQGDPGETQFYVSMDDMVMRVFGSDRAKAILQTLKIPEDQPIQNSMLAGSLEKAQEKIEGFHFDQRKFVLQYDDVMNTHRKVIYSRRQSILRNQKDTLEEMVRDINDESLNTRREELGDTVFFEIFRRVALQIIDQLWMQHLQVMEYTRQSVGLRAYGQREPLVEYTKEGLRLFRELEQAFREQTFKLMMSVDVKSFTENIQMRQQQDLQDPQTQQMQQNSQTQQMQQNSQTQQARQTEQMVARNRDKVSNLSRNEKITLVRGEETIEIKAKRADEYLQNGWKLK